MISRRKDAEVATARQEGLVKEEEEDMMRLRASSGPTARCTLIKI